MHQFSKLLVTKTELLGPEKQGSGDGFMGLVLQVMTEFDDVLELTQKPSIDVG